MLPTKKTVIVYKTTNFTLHVEVLKNGLVTKRIIGRNNGWNAILSPVGILTFHKIDGETFSKIRFDESVEGEHAFYNAFQRIATFIQSNYSRMELSVTNGSVRYEMGDFSLLPSDTHDTIIVGEGESVICHASGKVEFVGITKEEFLKISQFRRG